MKFVTTHLYPAHVLLFYHFHFNPANLNLTFEIYSSVSFYIYLVVL